MPAPNEVQVRASPSKGWLAACAMLCVAIIAYGVFGDRDTSGDIAYQLGYNLPIAIFLSGALHFAFRKRESARTSWIGFALVYASLIAASVVANNRQKTELRAVAADVQQTIAAVQSSVVSGSPPPPPMAISQVSSGETGKMEVVLKTMINRMIAQRREYELELEAIGWSKILDGQRLRGDATLAESRTILQQAKDIVAKYRSRTTELFAQLRRDIETSDLKAGNKRSMLAGFEKTADQSKAQTMELWSLEEQALAQIENTFNLLAARRGGWQIQDGQVMFHRQADLDLFNSYMSQAQAIVAKQEEIQSASLRRTQDSLTRLGK